MSDRITLSISTDTARDIIRVVGVVLEMVELYGERFSDFFSVKRDHVQENRLRELRQVLEEGIDATK